MLSATHMPVFYTLFSHYCNVHFNPAALYLESVAGHASPVFVDETRAFLLRIARGGKEHAFVALGFLFGAYAARLHLGLVGGGHVLEVCAHIGGGRWCCNCMCQLIGAFKVVSYRLGSIPDDMFLRVR